MPYTFNEPPNTLRDVVRVCVKEADWDAVWYSKEWGEEKERKIQTTCEINKKVSKDTII